MSHTISFPTGIENLDAFNDNVDVCIRCDDGTEYSVVVITPDNLSEIMKNACVCQGDGSLDTPRGVKG